MERMKRRSKNHTGMRKPSKLFVHKVLLGLQFLQGLPAYRNGARPKNITRYIKKHFTIDGDIFSQVMASLQECVHYGFVQKCDDRYLLVGPIANVQLLPHNSKFRNTELKRVRKIFSYDWRNYNKQRPPQEPKSRFGFQTFFNFIKNMPTMILDGLFGTKSTTTSSTSEMYRSSRTSRRPMTSSRNRSMMERDCAKVFNRRRRTVPVTRRSARLVSKLRKKRCVANVASGKVRKKPRCSAKKLSSKKIKNDSLDILFKCRNF